MGAMREKSISRTVTSKRIPESVQLVFCALGIYACYLNYGLLQERIYNATYGPMQLRFTFSTFLLCIQTLTNATGAALVLLLTRSPMSSPPRHAMKEYAIVALAYLMAMWFSFTALRHMSYPAQALGKSCKMVPVMLLGVVIRGRRYSIREYCSVLLITVGVAAFNFYKPVSKTTAPTSAFGLTLLGLSLLCDGITGPLQERLVARHRPSTHTLMLWQNMCAFGWLSAALIVSGEGREALAFVTRYPAVLKNVFTFAALSALGQNFIFYTVRHFSALAVTTITTTRKMFTVLLSVAVNKHQFVWQQWAGLVVVFSAISMEAVAKARRKTATTKAKKTDDDETIANGITATATKKAQ